MGLMGWSQRTVTRDTRTAGMVELTGQSCMAALPKMAGLVERLKRDEKKLLDS